ncbi:MAG: hypothetical protein QG620_504 [Patescibacteria group bacterium]|nr:hypothetical protein [Patescibacteria group bacterium]
MGSGVSLSLEAPRIMNLKCVYNRRKKHKHRDRDHNNSKNGQDKTKTLFVLSHKSQNTQHETYNIKQYLKKCFMFHVSCFMSLETANC